MPAIRGNMEAFDVAEESWSTYVDRFEMYVDCNSIPNEKKVSTLLTLVGVKTYNLLQNLCLPTKPSQKSYEEIVRLVQDHLHPKPSVIAERYRFSRRNQLDYETIAQYTTELKKLSTHCDFGIHLNDYLRDRLVSGIRSNAIKQRLLAETALTYDRAVEIAMSMEAAEKDASSLSHTSTSRVHHLASSNRGVPRPKFKPPQGQENYKLWEKTSAQVKTTANQGDKHTSNDANCTCCGRRGHLFKNCRYKDYKCHACGRQGHLISVCRTKQSTRRKNTFQNHYVNTADDETAVSFQSSNMFTMNSEVRNAPYKVEIMVQDKILCMEIDTGSPVSVISEQFYYENFPSLVLQETSLRLNSYVSDPIVPVGQIKVDVMYEGRKEQLCLYVIRGGGPPLVGREWISKLKLEILPPVNNFKLNADVSMKQIIDEFPEVCNDHLGTYKQGTVKLKLRENANPKFFKPRPIPFSLRSKVEAELDRLVEDNILTPVTTSDWGTPIVPVLKKNGQVRICGDFKVTLNPHLETDRYPIPRIEDLFAVLQKGKTFSKIDLSQAYQQVLLDEESRKLVTISTHKGLFAYNRIPYGVSSAPGIFQRIMEQILLGLPGVAVFLDDILITGSNADEHLHRLRQVFTRLRNNGLTVSQEKCTFFADSVEYLGFVIDKHGLHPSQGKIEAIVNAPIPNNVSQLKGFLGLVNYYGKFISNMASILHPLYNLLKKNVRWKFNRPCIDAFNKIKQSLCSSTVLAHYDPLLPLKLACDASAYGLGSVLSQVQENGTELPIAFASRTLTNAEKHYSQVDKEALSLIFGVRKFNQYLWGRHFTLCTDHKPLLSIFGPKQGLPTMAASRLQRYALILSGYDFDIIYIKSENHGNADGLSRLPLPYFPSSSDDYTYLNCIMDSPLPIKAVDIRKATNSDSLLSRILGYVKFGWPENVTDHSLIPYFRRKDQLTLEQGILMWGHRVIIPPTFRKRMLNELHASHLGIVKMKSLARSYIWWPSIDSDIENEAKNCLACLHERQNPCKSKLHVWEHPSGPWLRLHMDFLGPFNGKLYLIIVDAFSKWIEALEVRSTSAICIIQRLRETFARYGFPVHVVSDNGPPFTSRELHTFFDENGIYHTFSPPYHPQTNGLAENGVKQIKNVLKRALRDNIPFDLAINRFLLDYRNTPHSTTKESPAKLLQSRSLKTRLDLIRPNISTTISSNQHKQIANARGGKTRLLVEGQKVLARDYRGGNRWTQGIVIKKLGPVTYRIQLEDGLNWKRHIDQLILLNSSESANNVGLSNINNTQDEIDLSVPCAQVYGLPNVDNGTQQVGFTGNTTQLPTPQGDLQLTGETAAADTVPQTNGCNTTPKTRRYPLRDRKAPVRFPN